jgi:hypothetical protein
MKSLLEEVYCMIEKVQTAEYLQTNTTQYSAAFKKSISLPGLACLVIARKCVTRLGGQANLFKIAVAIYT